MDDAMVRDCDVLLGWMDDALLEARQRVGKHVPYVWFGLGNMTRGFSKLRTNAPFFRTTDVLICNCTGDVEVARKFLSNAPMRILPISYDEKSFYPSDEGARRDIKKEMGFGPDDKILLYAGRITVEKNVQSVVKIFSVLQGLVPDVHLAVVGQDVENPFMEFGVFPFATFSRMLKDVVAEAATLREQVGEPLAPTEFAQEFWRVCPPVRGPFPYYRYSPRSYQLYQEMIAPYAGAMSDGVAVDKPLAGDDVLCLASPVLLNDDDSVWVDDIIFPFSLTPPEAHAAAVRAALGALSGEPVMTFESLASRHLAGEQGAPEALGWMLDAGLILRTESGLAAPQTLGALMGTPLYTVQRVTPAVDIVLLG